MKWLTVLLCFCCAGGVYAQKTMDLLVNNRVILHSDGYIIYADVAREPSKQKADTRLFYYWYSANDIKKTKGGFQGKLLHGQYTKFYANKNLHTQGKFKKGIQVGEWKYWYHNGELSEIKHWRKKGTVADFEMFDQQGTLIRTGKYRNERYDGEIRDIQSGKVTKTKYRNGVEIVKKKKVKSDSVQNSPEKDRKFLGIIKRRSKADSVIKKDSTRKADPQKENGKKKDKKEKVDKKSEKVKKAPGLEPVETDTGKKKRKDKKDRKTSDVKPAGN